MARIKVERSKCLSCFSPLKRIGQRYCNNVCQSDKQYKDYIVRWKKGEETGDKAEGEISSHIRRYLFDKYGAKCSLCGWNKINPVTKKSPLNVEHIDGNSSNNKEENLTLL